MVIVRIIPLITINRITRNILTAAESCEKMRKIVTDTFSGFKCFANIQVLS
ncbi:MAG: hypothetical protein UHO61_07990 [Acutalibacteraceae bacterium]|nr:hypothetical protein [Acutalibacteraceae bacterium]